MALRMMDNIEMNNKAIFTRVTACHVTTYYYVGFAYMMMRRYSDAIKAFSHILTFVARTKQYHTRTYHYQTLNKQSEQMYSLLAICVTMCPTRLDEMLHSHLRDKYSEQQQKMHRGGEEALLTFEDLFMYACPKFVTANPPNYDEIIQYLQNKKQAQLKDTENNDNSDAESAAEDDDQEEIQAPKLPEPSRHQAAVFLSEARHQLLVPALRSYLRLYSTMEVEKLASFLEIDDVQHLRQQLLIFKLRSRQKKWVSGTLLEGTYSPAFDLDFYLREDVVHIAEYKVGRRYADWFIRHINKLEDNMSNSLKNQKSQHNAASSKSSASKESAGTQKAEAVSASA
ncbi:hypothetical protein IWQ62_005764 [Dispira parvispora]|uniref:Eukaryotic translation initiation factor 3 subunit L n=1 Tax=Dispira parvispora TaxID=1520584 RepID=A0A9W8DZA5_9FUNG|nr:hypothetical protein IWQ62_005764 [Dispira parvispora]